MIHKLRERLNMIPVAIEFGNLKLASLSIQQANRILSLLEDEKCEDCEPLAIETLRRRLAARSFHKSKGKDGSADMVTSRWKNYEGRLRPLAARKFKQGPRDFYRNQRRELKAVPLTDR